MNFLKQACLLLLFLCCLVDFLTGQRDSIAPAISWNAYAETYYLYNFSNPDNHTAPGFMYSYNRHNEVNINLAYVQGEYVSERVKGRLALMTGTYANANLAAEPGVLKNILEASTSFRISKKHQLWIEAGIFPSHIGFESAIGRRCWNMSRSMLADNSPYFLAGGRVNYTSNNGKWFFSGLILNGWQRITRISGNQTPAIGYQVTWTPKSNFVLNSSGFVGNDFPDSSKLLRVFHNFYAQVPINQKWSFLMGFDYGVQQSPASNSSYQPWYAPIVLLRYVPSPRWASSLRAEFFRDKHGVIIATGSPNGFETFGWSLNVDYSIAENVLWRIEFRGFSNRRDPIYQTRDKVASRNLAFAGTSICFSL